MVPESPPQVARRRTLSSSAIPIQMFRVFMAGPPSGRERVVSRNDSIAVETDRTASPAWKRPLAEPGEPLVGREPYSSLRVATSSIVTAGATKYGATSSSAMGSRGSVSADFSMKSSPVAVPAS